MTGINWRVTSNSNIGQQLQEILSRTRDRHGFHNLVGEHLLGEIDDRFHAEQGPDGEKWEALAPSTVKARLNKSTMGPVTILREKGRLAGSIYYEADRTKTEVGTPMIYAAIHHFGGTTGRDDKTDIPARPYMGVSSDDERAIIEIAEDWLKM